MSLNFLLKKTRTLVFTSTLVFKITGDERIELPLKVLETSVIPFDQSPIFNSISNIEKRRNRNYVLFLIYLQNFTQMITSYFPKNLFEKHISIPLRFISMDLLRKSTSIPIQPSANKFAKPAFSCTCFSPLFTD